MTPDTSPKIPTRCSEPDDSHDPTGRLRGAERKVGVLEGSSEPAHTNDPRPADCPDAGEGTRSDRQIGLVEGQWTPPPPLPEGTHRFVISASTGLLKGSRPWPTFIGLTVTVAEGPHAGRSFEQKVFRGVTNYGEVQRLVTATDLARAIEGPDAPERTFEEAAEVIEQARKQRLPFRAKVTWGAMDHAAYEQRLGKPCNARGLSMIWRSDKFDQVDEYGQPAARGIDGQLLRPQAYITRFLKRCESEIPDADAVRPRVGGQDERV